MAKPRETTSSPIRLELTSPCGPTLANHVGCLIDGVLYIHGGIDKHLSKEPLNAFYKLDLSSPSPMWQEIAAPNSPRLSHHACVVVDNRYVLLIGGWNGRRRVADVWAYDVRDGVWIGLATSGFPDGAGLSSHAAVRLADGSILVVGREGSARIQRRYGNAWLLRGSVSGSGRFVYDEARMALASRSGHTMHVVGSELTIVGGRSDRHVERHPGHRTGSASSSASAAFFADLKQFIRRQVAPLAKPPCGRKHHVSASGAGLVLVHGGETFDGKSRYPVSDFYAISFKPDVTWYHLGTSGVGRAGHVCCVSDDKIIIHGGFGARNTVYGDTYEIKLSK